MNNHLFPWFILVPRVKYVREICELNTQDQITLLQEVDYISKLLRKVLQPDKLNVAALGNIVDQLHIHVIARYHDDSAWPAPVFGVVGEKYSAEELSKLLAVLELR